MVHPSSFKEALLGNPNPSPDSNVIISNLHVSKSTTPLPLPLPIATSHVNVSSDLSQDPHPPPVFPECIVLDDLPQVKHDIAELSRTCSFSKMLSAPLDDRTIKSRTKTAWKFLKGDVDLLEMGNGWLLLRFANPRDLALVWSLRPWHIQGDLLVLQSWKRFFDLYLEEIQLVDLWVRIPRLPNELLKF